MTTVVRDARPPSLLIKVLNPIMRIVLSSSLGGLVKPFGLVEFSGRSTGRRYRVPVGVYRLGAIPVVFTPAAWRANFEGGAPAVVHHLGRAHAMTGELVRDPAQVAAGLRGVIATGASTRLLGLDVPPGHEIEASDVVLVDRAMIEFHPAEA